MKLHARSGLLIPDRGEIDDAWNVSGLRWMNKRLFVCGPGLHTPGPEARHSISIRRINKFKLFLQLQDLIAKVRDHEPIHELLKVAHARLLLQDVLHYFVGVKTVILHRLKEIDEKQVNVHHVGWHPQNDLWLGLRIFPQSGHMAKGAVHADKIHSEDLPFREADRPIYDVFLVMAFLEQGGLVLFLDKA